MKKHRTIIILIIAMLLPLFMLVLAYGQSKTIVRDPTVLINKYYYLKDHDPAAINALIILLKQDPNHLVALKELSYWYLQHQQFQLAKPLLLRLRTLEPDNKQTTMQLAYLYYSTGERARAYALFSRVANCPENKHCEISQAAMKAMILFYAPKPNISLPKIAVHPKPRSTTLYSVAAPAPKTVDTQLNRFYQLNKTHPKQALRLIRQIILRDPCNVLALQEGAYFAITEKQYELAICYFKRLYDLTHQSSYAMQLGYLEATYPTYRESYDYFKLATHSDDPKQVLVAQASMNNLTGLQTKVLPAPYFGSLYLAPFTQSRFGLVVTAFVARLGIESSNPWQGKAYFFFRRTADNKSQNLGQLPQIYQDNVQISGVGGQIKPIPRFPVIGYVEVGRAYDLIYQNRARWRNDVRGGLMYYQAFGAKPAYSEHLTLSHRYYSDWYADMTYFSRYSGNVIGLVRTHQGICALQHKSTTVNLYLSGRIIEDTQRYYYNNILEVGPGVSLIPSNRYNASLSFEYVYGYYLPANGPATNPYGPHYTSANLQLLVDLKI